MTEKTKKRNTANETKALTKTDPLVPVDQETRRDRLVCILCTDPTNLRQDAIRAGYSESFARSGIYSMVQSEAFQKKLRSYVLAHYKSVCIPKILRIDESVLNYLVKNPLDSAKYKDTIRRVQNVAGYLQEEKNSGAPTVNINTLTLISNGLAAFYKQKVRNASFEEVDEEEPKPNEKEA